MKGDKEMTPEVEEVFRVIKKSSKSLEMYMMFQEIAAINRRLTEIFTRFDENEGGKDMLKLLERFRRDKLISWKAYKKLKQIMEEKEELTLPDLTKVLFQHPHPDDNTV